MVAAVTGAENLRRLLADQSSVVGVEDLAALLVNAADEIAALIEAAAGLDAHIVLNGGCHRGCPEHDALEEALAAVERKLAQP